MTLVERLARINESQIGPMSNHRVTEYSLPDQQVVRDVVNEVRRRLSDVPERATMADDRLRILVEEYLVDVLASPAFVDASSANPLLRSTAIDDLLGFGPIQELLDDHQVSEIMVNGAGSVWVETDGTLRRTNRSFESDEALMRVIDRMVRSSGRRVDQSSPMVDSRLPDGSRLNVILPPLAVDGPSVTIRKFLSNHLTTDDLIAGGSLSQEASDFLESAVAAKLNIIVSGGTGTGKTTMLNILSSYIDPAERVVTIEDAVELTLNLPNLVRLEARPPNTEGAGEVTIRDLVRNALRMRPNRIVVGEVRGPETIDMLQAMNTGHEGSLSTVHANSPRDALRRMETMVLLGGNELPLRAVREQIASAIDIIVQLSRDRFGRRHVFAINEIVGMEGDVITAADLFLRDASEESVVDGVAPLPPLSPTGVTSHRITLHGRRGSL